MGSMFNCVLPDNIKVNAVQHNPKNRSYNDSEKMRLRRSFNSLSSISTRQKHLSTSSLLLQSPLKGCLCPWELKRSVNGSLKAWKLKMASLENIQNGPRRFLGLYFCGIRQNEPIDISSLS
ncbi:PPPDE putative thiol peptidase family protein [Striga asiatica]|uniref:PPPDE putative thiol peptidase family protein n=1 Tax=Striga asiatica TaxID=4170 RepID=A0A5A7PXL5_STRAF|nr:PPPDE putative thiol peptidase family protein [Striga asiatica]